MSLMPDNISKVCAKNDLISDESQINSTDSSNSSRSNTNSSDTLSMQTLRFVLDPAFALQLEELFGPVIPDGSVAAIPVVKIDLEFAKLIYDKWKDSTENAVNKTDSSIKTDKKKRNKNKKRNLNLNVLEKCERNLNENTKEPTSLKEIMDHEEALEIHKKEKLKQDKDAATKLKRKQLYSMYPGADPVVLDEIFEANGYSLEKCEKILEEKSTMQDLNLPKKETKLQKSFDKTYSEIISDFETGNWKSWVSGEVNEPIADTSTEASREAETLRENAAEHRSQQLEFLEKARGYNDRGMKTVASYYFQQSSCIKFKAKEENKSASQMIAAGKNASYKNTLDLHGLYVHEALQALQTFLQRKKEQMQLHSQTGLMTLTIITGKGRHSFEQKAKIRPAVKEYLTSNGYRFIEIPPGFEINFKCDGSDYVSDNDGDDDSDDSD
ncbi:NEDD4-binding protein 2 [Caerostris extrusa]|uniref:NEDD4-binding protein 2 n=1 Tax=Caerostris extrusa TaxID=172846 RepID=A0AAV4NCV5_CAEEX|nr:NEDD4-binding protein 2 [Caerostris extrusa]